MTGHLRRGRTDGTWYLRVELPRQSGQRRQRRETVRGNKEDAKRRLREIIVEIEKGIYAEGGRMSVASLAKCWLEATEHRVGARTFANYSAHVKFHIEPALGNVRSGALRPAHIEAALAQWVRGERNDGRKGQLSDRTILHLFNTLRTMCRWAVRAEILGRNPSANVTPPSAGRREMKALDLPGLTKLFEVVQGTELEHAVVVAVGTGLRRGELLGLRWSDVDAEAGRLTVRRSLEYVNHELRTKSPKTQQSARTIALAPFVVDALKRRRAQQAERRIQYGLGKDASGWVFTQADETPWPPHVFTLRFSRLVRKSKLPIVRFHDLRHTFGTLALESGVDLKTLSLALGHSNISVTATVYLHASDSLGRMAADRIDALMGSSLTPRSATAALPGAAPVPRDIKSARKKP